MLTTKILELKKMVISQATTVESMINKSIKGLIDRDENLLKEVIEIDEKSVNQMEIQIDEKCVSTLALFQPEAKDLRTIMMISKMNIDLERMGDSVVNIAESALYLITKPQIKPYNDIPKMTTEALKMLKDSIDAFINENEELSLLVCERDIVVDAYRDQILRELVTYMYDDPRTIERGLHILRIANNLERIADLSTNIAEETVYIKKGKIIKHHYEEV